MLIMGSFNTLKISLSSISSFLIRLSLQRGNQNVHIKELGPIQKMAMVQMAGIIFYNCYSGNHGFLVLGLRWFVGSIAHQKGTGRY